MTTINFISKTEAESVKIAKVRKIVTMITTIVLVVYLVGVSGLLGWWWYWAGKQKRESTQVDNLTIQLKSFSDAEVTTLRLLGRAGAVSDFLQNQGDASESAAILAAGTGAQVVGWEYVAGEQQVTVAGDDPESLKVYSDYLQQNYEQVQPADVIWDPENRWKGSFNISGHIKT